MLRAGLQWTSSANSYWRRWERKAGYHAQKKIMKSTIPISKRVEPDVGLYNCSAKYINH